MSVGSRGHDQRRAQPQSAQARARHRPCHWLGRSYGTKVAGNYGELYPQRTHAMVLDAALEHSLTEVEQVADEAMAAEVYFNRFTR